MCRVSNIYTYTCYYRYLYYNHDKYNVYVYNGISLCHTHGDIFHASFGFPAFTSLTHQTLWADRDNATTENVHFDLVR